MTTPAPTMSDYAMIIQSLSPAVAAKLTDKIKTFPLSIIREKDSGMIMMETIDCFGNPFYLGEVLVTAVEVEYDSVRGYGMLAGSDADKHFILAALDAAGQAHEQELFVTITTTLNAAKVEYENQLKRENILAESTKVQFGLMVEG